MNLEAGKPADIFVEYTNTKPPEGPEADRSQPALMRGVVCPLISLLISLLTNSMQRLGGCEKIDADKAIEAAVTLAAESDVVLVVAGLSPEWESEGFDRPTLVVPGRQDELIARVAQANANTVVCIQAVSSLYASRAPMMEYIYILTVYRALRLRCHGSAACMASSRRGTRATRPVTRLRTSCMVQSTRADASR
jgi:hypothetical protein